MRIYPNRITRSFWLPVLGGFLLLAASASGAQTQWPDYMATLTTSPPESAVAAQLPTNSAIQAVAESLPDDRARWSGNWNGWACFARQCAARIAVESVDADGAQIAYAAASAFQKPHQERASGTFVNSELHVTLASGSQLVLRLRDPATMEMALFNDEQTLLAAGVLSNQPFPYSRHILRVPTAWKKSSGDPQTLEMVAYRPNGKGPFPTLLFNHGSTGAGNDPEVAKLTVSAPELGQYFTERGWQVLFPQRRGRGNSDGNYEEGLQQQPKQYSCDPEIALAGFDYASESMDAVMAYLPKLADVDQKQVLIGGSSRGGILAIAYAGEHPDKFVGAINFVGGWMSDRCPQIGKINPVLFERGVFFEQPTLWLYGENDPFYSTRHSKNNFHAFNKAGGLGDFHVLRMPPGISGHLLPMVPQQWLNLMDEFLSRLD